MRVNFFLIIGFLLVAFSGFSQGMGITYSFGGGETKADGIVFKKDKQQIAGEVHFPGFKDKKVKVKVEGKNQKFEGKDVDSVQIFDKNKKLAYTFVYTKTQKYKNKRAELKPLSEGWLCKTIEGKVSLYLGGLTYGIKEVKMESDTVKEGKKKVDKIKVEKMMVVTTDVHHYLKRKNEDYPILVSLSSNAVSIGYNAFFKEFGVYYFSDKPEIAKKIEEKEYKYDDIEKVVNLYNVKPVKKREQKAEQKAEQKTTKPKAVTKPVPKNTKKK